MTFIPELALPAPFELHEAEVMIREALGSLPAFDAVICSSDVMAMGAMTAFAKAGLKVPEDTAVVGYDDIALAMGMPRGSLGPTRRRCLDKMRTQLENVVSGSAERPPRE